MARHLRADLVGRGLDAADGLLVVIDGAKVLSAAVTAVFVANAAIQRCTVHKRRNVAEHLPEDQRGWVDAKLVRALNDPDAAAGLRDAKALATALERKHPGAATSLREGLPELFTVARLGITGTPAKTLTSSNPIESMISIARATNRNLTRWRDGQMVLRWTAAGMLNAQRSFRRRTRARRRCSFAAQCDLRGLRLGQDRTHPAAGRGVRPAGRIRDRARPQQRPRPPRRRLAGAA